MSSGRGTSQSFRSNGIEEVWCPHPGWQRGLYPRRSGIEAAIRKGDLYLGRDDGGVVGAVILDENPPPGYEKGHWAGTFSDQDLFYIHTFAVHPETQGQGYGKKMLAAIIDYSRACGKAGLRLDVMKGYHRAEGLYQRMGFQFVDEVELFYEDVGWKAFHLYEYLL